MPEKNVVPAEIRAVKRPKNTVVYDTHGKGIHRYAVRERAGVKYVRNGFPQPSNGKVIGHIINGQFVPKIAKSHLKPVQEQYPFLSYGSAALVKSVAEDLFDDLLKFFSINDSCSIMAMAALRVISLDDIPSSRMAAEYRTSFLSRFYPNAALSCQSVSKLLERIGMHDEERRNFYLRRIERVKEEHHIIIDGMLKQDTSEVNDLSAFSRKYRVRGCRDISVIYAYDFENSEVICAKVYPGNMIDAGAYRDFIRDSGLSRGVIIADKGFPPSQIKDELDANRELHFLTPIKNNDTRIMSNQMLDFEDILLECTDDKLQYRKKRIKGDRFLYSFRSEKKAAEQENAWLGKELRKKRADGGKYDNSIFEKKRRFFGVIVFESDLDLTPAAAYNCFNERWKIEVVFRQYKNDLNLNTTRVHMDFSVIGSEFINSIAVIITNRIVRKMCQAELFRDISFRSLMRELDVLWRRTNAPEGMPRTNDEFWVNRFEGSLERMEKLGLSEPEPKPAPKKRGRKSKKELAEQAAMKQAADEASVIP